MRLYCGIDLHSTNAMVVIIDERGKCLYRRRLPSSLAEILAALSRFKSELEGVVVESTFNWYWLVDGLLDAGHCVHLANTTAIRQYS